jgi:hypothetical protein
MHAPTLQLHVRRRHAPHRPFRRAVEVAAARPARHSVADDPSRARIRSVRLIPLIVPGMAVFLLLCLGFIGSVL